MKFSNIPRFLYDSPVHDWYYKLRRKTQKLLHAQWQQLAKNSEIEYSLVECVDWRDLRDLKGKLREQVANIRRAGLTENRARLELQHRHWRIVIRERPLILPNDPYTTIVSLKVDIVPKRQYHFFLHERHKFLELVNFKAIGSAIHFAMKQFPQGKLFIENTEKTVKALKVDKADPPPAEPINLPPDLKKSFRLSASAAGRTIFDSESLLQLLRVKNGTIMLFVSDRELGGYAWVSALGTSDIKWLFDMAAATLDRMHELDLIE